MEDLRKEQIEAVETLEEYNKKMVSTIPTIIEELKGQKKPDTQDFLNHIIEGMNWEIQVMNGTMTYFNENEMLVDKDVFDRKVLDFNAVVEKKDAAALADALETIILPMFQELDEIIAKKKSE